MPSHRPSSGQLGQRMSFHSLVALRPDATQSFLAQVAKHLGGNVQLQSGVSSIMVQTAEQKKRLRYKEDLLNNREPPTRTETNRRLLEEVRHRLKRCASTFWFTTETSAPQSKTSVIRQQNVVCQRFGLTLTLFLKQVLPLLWGIVCGASGVWCELSSVWRLWCPVCNV